MLLLCVAPGLVNLLAAGRPDAQAGNFVGSIQSTPLGTLVGSLLLFVVVAVASWLTLSGDRATPMSRLLVAALVSTPWIVLTGIGQIYLGASLSLQLIAYPLFILAICLNPCAHQMGKVLAIATIGLAILSLLLALYGQLGLMNNWAYGAEKSVIPGAPLAGPFSHPNILGMSLALGLPFVLQYARSLARILGVALVLFALLWSGSRTGWGGAGAVLALASVRRCVGGRGRRTVISLTLWVSGGLIIALPLIVDSPSSYTGRALIWMDTLSAISAGPLWTGFGPLSFDQTSILTTRIGYASSHGHNLFVTYLGRGGLIAVVGLGIGLAVISWRIVRRLDAHYAPTLFLVSLMIMSIFEGTLEFTRVSGQSGVTWAGLAIAIVVAYPGWTASVNPSQEERISDGLVPSFSEKAVRGNG